MAFRSFHKSFYLLTSQIQIIPHPTVVQKRKQNTFTSPFSRQKMRIAEISTPEITRPTATTTAAVSTFSDQIKLVLSQIESSIQQTEHLSPNTPFPDSLLSDLRLGFSQLSQLAPFPNSLKLHIWKLSYRLWNACVDLSNSATSSAANKSSTDHAKLRHFASDLLSLAADVSGVPSPALKSASFYYKTGLIWHDLRNFDLALTCFEKAADLTSKIEADSSISGNAEEKTLLFEVNLARSRTAWELSDRNLAVTLLNRAKSLLVGSSEHYRALANQYLVFGKSLLSRNDGDSDGVCVTEALKLMNEGLELCERGLSTARTREETIGVKGMRSRALRFVAAVHLQAGEFESVLKCIRILRDKDGGVNGNGGDQHPSLPVLAMKAWLGLGRYAEAEKELRGLVLNKGIPEGIWVSAVEAYFQAAGAAGAEIVKGVFLGLLGRCYVSAGSAVRIVHRVIGDGAGGGGGVIEGSRTRAKVVADLVSDERVVALFAGEKAAKERTAMHALLWNWAADHFRSKDYEMSAEMFEKSMFYVPHDIESRVLRAKGFRVLCLCHLGLSQLDRAQEYINEAEKLEPNIACAFLKFKVYLQKNDHSAAIAQIQTMSTCLDFMPDFLSLSAHEAVACRALPVAVASLSNLLNFYSSTKSMPTPEVVVLRNLVTILSLDPGNEREVLKSMKRAHNRVCELGADSFFGRGEVGNRERNWFAVNAWNFGAKAGREKTYDLCAEFLRLASEFHGVRVNSEVEENSTMVCKSIILAVSAIIASEKEKKAPLLNTEVKEAAELLDRAGKILKSNTSETQLSVNQSTTIEADFFYKYILNAYYIHGRLNDTGSQQFLLVKSFATSKACNFKYLLQIGLTASQGPRSNHEVASFALKECLSGMLSSLSPDYQKVALILRKLIALASIHRGDTDDDAVYGTYKQAYGIMVGLREGEYPTEEGKWLAITAWNRAALSVRLGQIDLARKWMNIGLQLARKVSGMETYKACMEDYFAGFEKKFPDHVNV